MTSSFLMFTPLPTLAVIVLGFGSSFACQKTMFGCNSRTIDTLALIVRTVEGCLGIVGLDRHGLLELTGVIAGFQRRNDLAFFAGLHVIRLQRGSGASAGRPDIRDVDQLVAFVLVLERKDSGIGSRGWGFFEFSFLPSELCLGQ